MSTSRKEWSLKLDDALWMYNIAFKTSICMSPYHMVYDKPCHLPVELEHKACCAMKLLNFNMPTVGEKQLLQLNEMDEFQNSAYENAQFTKRRQRCDMTSISYGASS